MNHSKAIRRILAYIFVAIVCALPFVIGSTYLYGYAEEVDTFPMEEYEGLRWAPGSGKLAFLHRPLNTDPPMPTEVWQVASDGTSFRQIAALPVGTKWTLTRQETESWMLLNDTKETADTSMLLVREGDEPKSLELEKGWSRLPSQGRGLFFQTIEENIPFDQFVDVEEMVEPDGEYQDEGEGEHTFTLPTRSGLKIAEYDPDSDSLRTFLSIPYNSPEEQPVVRMVRCSPDERFLALVIEFRKSGSPGLWVYDSENSRLLWTRVVLDGRIKGIDWSSDSVRIAVTDQSGVSILEQALGIRSVRLDVVSSEDLRPKWGAGSNLYLLSEHSVYKVDQDEGLARPLFDVGSEFDAAADLVLDPIHEVVAFSASPKGYRELFVRDLRKNKDLARVSYPGSLKEKAQGTVTYQLGDAIRYAWKKWTGRG